MAQFATAADLASYLGETFDAAQTARANSLLSMASAAIQSHTGQQLERVVGDIAELRGTFDTQLRLTEHPVVDVSAVTIDGTAVSGWWLAGGSLWRHAGWGGPQAAVSVTYAHGHDPIPDDVQLVCIQAAARAWLNPQAIRQESIGSYSVTYAETTGGISGGVTLTDEEKRLLTRGYRSTVLT